ncbi:cupin domain-containing protein [Actinobacteria bacterium YIM 96077]|uniref:Cupin n=2 Tax=Phytoactinopolyspora halophila TaxID=1981511 RepID=A0A329QD60_9ACTN|nr:cupin domain-containing protein [Actinobacteria bacterium YIM 96077]RAW10300.1 cupin [Phytoactinopolyspora halophila]
MRVPGGVIPGAVPDGEGTPSAAGFPGGTGVSRVRVYDWPTPDGQRGGSPHLHTASTEGYVVLGGEGVLETLSGDGYAEYRLAPDTVLWFTPGTIHRLVNVSGDLDILVVMQNAGLPEAGDAVFTFPPEVLEDPERYTREAALPPGDAEERSEAARRRRDLAIEGYLALRERVAADGPAALTPLYEAAAALVRRRVAGWRSIWQLRPLGQAVKTGAHLDLLESGAAPHLASSSVTSADARPATFGMCGHLSAWDLHAPVHTSG